MVKNSSRRHFLRSASLTAAAATLPLAEALPAAASPLTPFKVFPAAEIASDIQALAATPGNNNLFQQAELPFTIVLTTEVKKAAKEFEWHEGRDHILQILDGSCTYELGGTPQGSHNPKPQEWLAPASQDAKLFTLHKGDMLVIPRGTPHRRTTAESVTFYLISTTGNA